MSTEYSKKTPPGIIVSENANCINLTILQKFNKNLKVFTVLMFGFSLLMFLNAFKYDQTEIQKLTFFWVSLFGLLAGIASTVYLFLGKKIIRVGEKMIIVQSVPSFMKKRKEIPTSKIDKIICEPRNLGLANKKVKNYELAILQLNGERYNILSETSTSIPNRIKYVHDVLKVAAKLPGRGA